MLPYSDLLERVEVVSRLTMCYKKGEFEGAAPQNPSSYSIEVIYTETLSEKGIV
jgi:hypothetical protein